MLRKIYCPLELRPSEDQAILSMLPSGLVRQSSSNLLTQLHSHLKQQQRHFYFSPCLSMSLGRRAVRLLPAADRLKRFGNYNLLLPTNDVLLGETLQMSLLQVPVGIQRPEYDFTTGKPLVVLQQPHINSEAEIVGMRAAGKLARQVLADAAAMAVAGISTLDIDAAAHFTAMPYDSIEFVPVHQNIIASGAYPSPLGYLNFPRSVCTSINNVICHGIPDSRILQSGDIINIDVTVYLNGFHGDTSTSILIGEVDDAGRALVAATKEALDAGIAACGPGVPFREIGASISKVARAHGYSVNKDFCGHGIGRQFHQPPFVLHYENHDTEIMEPGMTFTVEPILCQGSGNYIKWPDAWTVVTLDGGRAAQFEHTVLVSDHAVEILT
ncbi:hypothetical protein BASA60_000382 [Batrachochytrium salamandrivorans]|nr:hypothetical protein BASA60_000382 [Batrachochytrium salamandrivorans]